MVKVGKWIAKHKVLVLLIGLLQLRSAELPAGDAGDSERAGYYGG